MKKKEKEDLEVLIKLLKKRPWLIGSFIDQIESLIEQDKLVEINSKRKKVFWIDEYGDRRWYFEDNGQQY